jgi:prepilin-type N-terminal cleavage/methylation domain-containing protein
MNRFMLNENGFTLIEVIVSLVLVGILATIVGLGLVQITKGYVFAKQNSETVQKAQIAMTRIVKELGAATIINSTTTAPSVNYTRPESATSTTPVTNNIMLSGSTVKIGSPGSETTLIDNVTAFTLTYGYAAGSTTTAAANIRRIDVTLSLTGADNQTFDFANSVWINESY